MRLRWIFPLGIRCGSFKLLVGICDEVVLFSSLVIRTVEVLTVWSDNMGPDLGSFCGSCETLFLAVADGYKVFICRSFIGFDSVWEGILVALLVFPVAASYGRPRSPCLPIRVIPNWINERRRVASFAASFWYPQFVQWTVGIFKDWSRVDLIETFFEGG